MSSCPHCGSPNQADRLRCAHCGALCFGARTTTVPRSKHDTMRASREVMERPSSRVPRGSAKTRVPSSVQETAGAWLVAEVLEKPYPIHRAFPVHLGRGPENHIVLPVQHVSRRHATIQWAEVGFEIVDRGSMNGTRVNGEIVTRHRLAEDDRVRIGPIEFVFGTRAIDAAPRLDAGDTSTDLGPAVSQMSFAGALCDVKLQDVWQMLELGQKTGRLVVQQADRRGAVVFQEGRALHAELDALVGEEAALELLLLSAGSFRFLPSTRIEVSQTIKKPATSLLLEAARRLDESTGEVA